MNRNYVITGDIIGFTNITVSKRKKLLAESAKLFSSWVEDPAHARIFRGDSFQILFRETGIALKRAIQLRCWFKKHSPSSKILLDARMVIGVGKISYYGKSVLDSDGEAFHLSGRAFDDLEEGENLNIITADQIKNEQLKVIFSLAELIMSNWTINQAEVIFLLLEGRTQQEMAEELKIGQSAVNNRIKLAKWKEIEKMIRYVDYLIEME